MDTKELISAVGSAMQEAYEQLERRSLENCLSGCFEAVERGGELELHFRLRESPEGLARIETELNRRSAL